MNGKSSIQRSHEPVWWGLFSAGGVVAAVFLPVLILIIGLMIPFDLIDEAAISYERMQHAVDNFFMKMILWAVIALPFFHFAHRFYFTVTHTGLWKHKAILAVLSYGGAILGSVIAAVLLLRV